MRCAACGTDKPPAAFSNSQKKKTAGARKCSACVAPPPTVAAVDASDASAHAGADAGDASAGADAGDARPRTAAVVAPGGAAGANRAASTSVEPRAAPLDTTPPRATAPPGSSAGAAQLVGATADPPASSLKFCAWAGCGKPLPGKRKRCNRCRRAWYCDQACQKKHWQEGGHRKVCEEPPCCTICLDGGEDPEPIQCGCACRGDAGLAHVACRAEVAARKQPGIHDGWTICPTCGQDYTGAMAVGLAREHVSQLGTRRRDDAHRLGAANNLGHALMYAGELAEAADVLAGVLVAAKRVFGKEHPNTLSAAANLANTYSEQGKLAEAEELQDWVLEATRRANGKEHLDTLRSIGDLAATYQMQGRFAEAEALLVKVLEVRRRVLGPDHPEALTAATNLATAFVCQSKLAEAVALQEETLATSRRVLGAGHRDTLAAAKNLAVTYHELGQDARAVELRTLYNR